MTDLEKRIKVRLMERNVSPKLKGFEYLVTAIRLMYEDPTYFVKFTSRLYPDMAENFDTTPEAVERSMRYALRTAGLGTYVSAYVTLIAEELRCENE